MLFKPVMVRVGIKRDKDGVYPDRNCVTSVKPPDYQPKRGRWPAAPPQAPATGHAQGADVAAHAGNAGGAAASSGDAPWRS